MGYTAYVRPRILDKFVTVHGANGPEQALAPVPAPDYPPTFVQKVWEDLTDLYGEDPRRRTELWQDAAGYATMADVDAACPGIRPWKEAQLREEGARRLALLAAPYRAEERETWPYQRAEALAWQADNSVATPYCDIIAAGRGIPRELFLPKVIENSTLFSQASAALLGQQQALVDRAWSERNIAAFLEIAWPTT